MRATSSVIVDRRGLGTIAPKPFTVPRVLAAVVALVGYVALMLTAFKVFGVVLTAAGIADPERAAIVEIVAAETWNQV